jgi:ring-1,2-phenylacetyl-CoA epoxidase subunit PaaA
MDDVKFQAFLDQGGTVDLNDPMPEAYKQAARRVIGFQCLSEIVGGMMFAEWIPKTPGLLRKMMLTAKIQDEMGHAHYLLRICEELGLSRRQIIEDYLNGKSKLLNTFHYRIETWHEWPASALISNSAALIQFKSLSKVSFLPYARAIKRIMKEESFHYHHALNLATQLCNSGPEHLSKVQDGVDKWWFPVLAYFGPPDSHNFQMQQNARWRLKIDSNDDLRQQWLTKMVPVIQNIGLTIPDPNLRWDEEIQKWDFTEPDWDEVKRIIKGGGPASAYWHETLTRCYNNQEWVRNLTYNEGALVA